MASDLKKVGLILKADGSADFVKSMRNVNAVLEENFQSFKLSQSQWDKNTTTAEKLGSRIEFLTNRYDAQRDKVVLLSQELKELESAENRDEVAIKRKEAALKGAEAQLNNYQRAMVDVQKEIDSGTAKLQDMANTLDRHGDALVSSGKKMSVFTAAYAAASGIAVKSAMDFETAFTGVKKTVDGTPEQLERVEKGIRDMAKVMPTSAVEIANVAETAGQLGIATDDILSFTEVMIKMGQTTNLSAEEGANAIARFTNVTGMSVKNTDRLVSSIVALGNNSATTEAEIMNMASNLAGASTQAKISEADIMAISASLSSLGIEAQAGGTAFSKVISGMQVAVETGSDSLEDFASVAEMSGEQFQKAFKEDATGALMAFVEGLASAEENGTSAIVMLDEMGIKETRLRDALLKAAAGNDVFRQSLETSRDAWADNTALTDEYGNILETTEAKMAIAKNSLNDIAITFGEIFLPVINEVLEHVKNFANWVSSMDPVMQRTIVIIGAIVAAIGPLLIFIGKIAQGVSALIGIFVKLGPIITAIKASIVTFAGALSLPVAAVVAIVAAIAAAVVAIVVYWDEIVEFTTAMFTSIGEAFGNFGTWFSEKVTEIGTFFKGLWDNATGWISQFIEDSKENIGNFIDGFVEGFNNIVSTVTEFFTNMWETIVESVKSFIDTVLKILQGPIDVIKNIGILIVALIAIALESIWNLIKPFIDGIVEGFENFRTFISEKIDMIVEHFQNFVTSVTTAISNFIATAVEHFNNFKELISGIIENIQNFFIEKFEAIRDKVTEIFTEVGEFMSGVGTKIEEIWNNVSSFIQDNVLTPLGNFFTNIFEGIGKTISNVVEGIKTAFQGVKDFVFTIFNNVRDAIATVFETVAGLIVAPINGVIGLINNVIRSLNKIKVPDWVPGLGGVGVDLPEINYMATGGDLISGSAIVGERGAELLTVSGGKSTVTPLTSGGGSAEHDLIDYDKMGKSFVRALASVKFEIGDDGLGKFVNDYLLEVM